VSRSGAAEPIAVVRTPLSAKSYLHDELELLAAHASGIQAFADTHGTAWRMSSIDSYSGGAAPIDAKETTSDAAVNPKITPG
jgi:hypothetical protein